MSPKSKVQLQGKIFQFVFFRRIFFLLCVLFRGKFFFIILIFLFSGRYFLILLFEFRGKIYFYSYYSGKIFFILIIHGEDILLFLLFRRRYFFYFYYSGVGMALVTSTTSRVGDMPGSPAATTSNHFYFIFLKASS